jgi:hypothetical protein
MLSNTMAGVAARQKAKIAFLRSSSSSDQAAAGAGWPVTAATSIFTSVDFPAALISAGTMTCGMASHWERSMSASSAAQS